MNSIMTISPYKDQGMWMFDDPAKELHRELLVGGTDDIMDALCNGRDQFNLIFSGIGFPGYEHSFTWIREGDGGNYYSWDGEGMVGWLCPALLKYFDKAPEKLYVKVMRV